MKELDKSQSKLENTILSYFFKKGEITPKAEMYFDLKKTFPYFLTDKKIGTLHVKDGGEISEYKISLKHNILKRKKWEVRCQGGTLCDDPNKMLDIHIKECVKPETKEKDFTIDSMVEHKCKGGFSTWFYNDNLDTMRKLYEKIPAAKHLMTYQALKYAGMTFFGATVGIELAKRLVVQGNFWLTLVYSIGAYATSAAVQTWMAKHNAEKITNKTPNTLSSKLFNKEGVLMSSNKEMNTWAYFEKTVLEMFEQNKLSDQTLKDKNFAERLHEGYFNKKFDIYVAIKNAKSKKEKVNIIKSMIPIDYGLLDEKQIKEFEKVVGKLKEIDENYIKELGKKLFESFENKQLLVDAMKPSLEKFLKEDYVKLVTGEDKTKKMKLEDITALLEQTIKGSIRKNTVDEDYEVVHKTTEVNTFCTGLEVINYVAGYSLLFFTANPMYVLTYYGLSSLTESVENTGQFRTWGTIFLEYYRRVMQDTNVNQEQVWQDHDATFTKCSYKGGAIGTIGGFGMQALSNMVIKPQYTSQIYQKIIEKVPEGVEQVVQEGTKVIYKVPTLFEAWNVPITYDSIPTLLLGGVVSLGIYFVGLNYYFKWKNELKGQIKQELTEKNPDSPFLSEEYQRSIPKKIMHKVGTPFSKAYHSATSLFYKEKLEDKVD
ncbi:MAG: hypothetical protein Q8O03_05480 [Nanoarchaeota archaeon]|nr:hypothetical protein [Nanoarchaeota archaeon]